MPLNPVLAFHADLAACIARLRELQSLLPGLAGVQFIEASLAGGELGSSCCALEKVERHMIHAFYRAKANGGESHAQESVPASSPDPAGSGPVRAGVCRPVASGEDAADGTTDAPVL